jgi:hypothetical protein
MSSPLVRRQLSRLVATHHHRSAVGLSAEWWPRVEMETGVFRTAGGDCDHSDCLGTPEKYPAQNFKKAFCADPPISRRDGTTNAEGRSQRLRRSPEFAKNQLLIFAPDAFRRVDIPRPPTVPSSFRLGENFSGMGGPVGSSPVLLDASLATNRIATTHVQTHTNTLTRRLLALTDAPTGAPPSRPRPIATNSNDSSERQSCRPEC